MLIEPKTVWFTGIDGNGKETEITTEDLIDLEFRLRLIAGSCTALAKDGIAQEVMKAVNALQILKSTHRPEPEPTLNDRFDQIVEEHMDGVTRSFDSDYRVRFVALRKTGNAMPLPEGAYDTVPVYVNREHEIFKGCMKGTFETGEDAEQWAELALRTSGFIRCEVAAEVIE